MRADPHTGRVTFTSPVSGMEMRLLTHEETSEYFARRIAEERDEFLNRCVKHIGEDFDRFAALPTQTQVEWMEAARECAGRDEALPPVPAPAPAAFTRAYSTCTLTMRDPVTGESTVLASDADVKVATPDLPPIPTINPNRFSCSATLPATAFQWDARQLFGQAGVLMAATLVMRTENAEWRFLIDGLSLITRPRRYRPLTRAQKLNRIRKALRAERKARRRARRR